ncbi:MAG: hypothetical protein U5N86_01645 [Planctomycetota bacterium]|nr:hypothetical protein [Planctomycetota bacterium]
MTMTRTFITATLTVLLIAFCASAVAEEKVKTASFTVKVVYAKKADKKDIPPSLKDFEEALEDAASEYDVNAFTEYKSFVLAAKIGDSSEEKLGVLEYKIKIEPTEYKDEKLSTKLSLIKIETKKNKVLLKTKVSFKEEKILVFDIGKHSGGQLFVATRLDSVK